MTKIAPVTLLLVLLLCSTTTQGASETLTAEPSGEAYNYVTHYRVLIDAPTSEVWPVLMDFNLWMYEFEQSSVAGTPGTVGHVFRLYEGQDFLTQITAIVPERMVSIVNLPLTFNGEFGTGVAIITLHESDKMTEVSLSMSRRYSPAGEGYNEMRAIRDSGEFQERTRAMWKDRFLGRLKSLAEGRLDEA